MNWITGVIGLTIILLAIASIMWAKAYKNRKINNYNEAKTNQNNKNYINIIEIVSITNSLVAIVVGIITVWVMISQKNMQQIVIDIQKQEHQPSFEIDYKHHCVSNLEFEDFYIINHGEPFKSISVSTETFINVNYFDTNYPKNIEINTYINVNDYYGVGFATGAIIGEVYRTYVGKIKNTEMLKTWVEESRQYNQDHTDSFYISKLSYVIIKYVDIYGDPHIEYFRNGDPCTEQSYNEVRAISQTHFGEETWLKSFYISEIKFPDILANCNPIYKIKQQ
ncbi:MAG: hypothetical protein J6K33_02440 [Alistipes sp.]|nr:hypothetical protein [Alistipes sp.]